MRVWRAPRARKSALTSCAAPGISRGGQQDAGEPDQRELIGEGRGCSRRLWILTEPALVQRRALGGDWHRVG